MSLATVEPYASGAMPRVGHHAVVVGAGMAGLLAARALIDAFDRVTVLDRDVLPARPGARKGVPQGRHPHALLEAGRATLDDLFSDFSNEVVRAGGLVVGVGTEARQFDRGGFLAPTTTPRTLLSASRPLIEAVTRRRLGTCAGIRLRGACRMVDYLLDGATRIRGVAVHDEQGDLEELGADLVVDATGRASRTAAWLTDHGFAAPRRDEVGIDLGYATRVIERPGDDRRTLLIQADPPDRRGGALVPIESGRWLLTLAGVHGDHPPLEPHGFSEFAATLPSPALARILEAHPPAAQTIERYRFRANVRHRYEDLDRLPDGLIAIGDAIASFNPVYGQGISVAALQSLALHRALLDGGTEDLPRRFFARAGQVVDGAWLMAVGTDFRFPQTRGPKPPGTDLVNRYLARLTRRAQRDHRLADAFFDAMFMTSPATRLLGPATLWRTLRPLRPG
jgi:flavin-dependent dehydrogenase